MEENSAQPNTTQKCKKFQIRDAIITHLIKRTRQVLTLATVSVLSVIAVAACSHTSVGAESAPAVEQFPRYVSATTQPVRASAVAIETAKALGRGINLGNVFDSPLGNGDWGISMRGDYYDKIKNAGFTTVRLPVRWSNHASVDAQAVIDEVFARRVDEAVDGFLARGLYVVLDMHHYRQLDGDGLDNGELRVADNVVRIRYLNMWRQIAARYKDKSPKLVLELYNEPHGQLNNDWNDLASRALAVVRQSNPTRLVVIGPTQWNSANALAQLQLPPDPNLIVTVHNYDPFEFTHQGADWVKPTPPLGTTCCTANQRESVARPLELAYNWGQRNGYPIWLGEFGAYSKAPNASRAIYTRIVREEAEKRGINWAYWEFGSGHGIYDPRADTWNDDLVRALVGK